MIDDRIAGSPRYRLTRRALLAGGAAAALAGSVPTRFALGQQAKVKLGLMLPYSGTYAALGQNITDAIKLAIAEKGGKLGGREIEYVQVDDESEPAKAPQNANRVVVGEKADFFIGTVHSGVVMAMVKVAREENALLIIPNAGAGAATGQFCAPNIFRTSFSNWQPAFPMGAVAAKRGHKTAAVMAWKYGAGEESVQGFTEGFTKAGGKVVKEFWVPFPDVEFQAQLTELAALKPDALFVFFAGGGAAKFVKDYDGAGLRKSIPLYSTGFLTDGVLKAQGAAAEGLFTTLHYAENLDNPVNKRFRADFQKQTGRAADVYAVQGYDTGQLLIQAMDAVKGDVKAREPMIKAMRAATIDSPRGKFTFSASHNPVQDIYLRTVANGENQFVEVAHKALADPAAGCKMT
ncbi:MAG: ABC transporter substrate-binding protein [Proteobacteria bacterium]|nr:ABC transporter substrate-binding protein [Pseudomonadota bacterium]MBI3496392.1 ABC transporter substrate-binding protein [Pseudomonadota bacterium]